MKIHLRSRTEGEFVQKRHDSMISCDQLTIQCGTDSIEKNKTEDIIVYMGVPGKRMSEEEC